MANKTYITWDEYDDMINKIAVYIKHISEEEIGAN